MNDAAEARDDVLLRRLAAGDEEAFLTLYRRHHQAIYRYALHMTGRHDAAEEVVQEVFMLVIREGEKFDPRRGELAGFLFGVARNHVRRLLQTDSRYQALPEDEVEVLAQHSAAPVFHERADLGDEIDRAQAAEQVRRAVLSLPERYREVVTLCDLEEMPYEQAAAVLGCPVGTVRSRLNRGREMLGEKLRASLAPKPAPRISAARAFDSR